jgi:hypothetical protein
MCVVNKILMRVVVHVQFINSYMAIIYSVLFENDMGKLFTQILTVLVAKQALDFLKDIVKPRIDYNRRIKKLYEKLAEAKHKLVTVRS